MWDSNGEGHWEMSSGEVRVDGCSIKCPDDTGGIDVYTTTEEFFRNHLLPRGHMS